MLHSDSEKKSKKRPSNSSSLPQMSSPLFQESTLIRTFVFAQCIMIFICFLFYFTYFLFYDYLTIVIFSVISSIALRKTKDKIVKKLSDLIYSVERSNYKNSILYSSIEWLYDNILNFKSNRKALFRNLLRSIQNFNFTNDVYVISCIFIVYWLFFNLHLPLGLTIGLFFSIMVFELILRGCLDVFYWFKEKLGFSLDKKDNKSHIFLFFFNDQEKTRIMINHSITILMIIVFFFMMIGIVLLFLGLCHRDIKLFLVKSGNFIDIFIQKVNQSFGIEFDSFKFNSLLTKNIEEIFNFFLNKQEVSTVLEFLRSLLFIFNFLIKNIIINRLF